MIIRIDIANLDLRQKNIQLSGKHRMICHDLSFGNVCCEQIYKDFERKLYCYK